MFNENVHCVWKFKVNLFLFSRYCFCRTGRAEPNTDLKLVRSSHWSDLVLGRNVLDLIFWVHREIFRIVWSRYHTTMEKYLPWSLFAFTLAKLCLFRSFSSHYHLPSPLDRYLAYCNASSFRLPLLDFCFVREFWFCIGGLIGGGEFHMPWPAFLVFKSSYTFTSLFWPGVNCGSAWFLKLKSNGYSRLVLNFVAIWGICPASARDFAYRPLNSPPSLIFCVIGGSGLLAVIESCLPMMVLRFKPTFLVIPSDCSFSIAWMAGGMLETLLPSD